MQEFYRQAFNVVVQFPKEATKPKRIEKKIQIVMNQIKSTKRLTVDDCLNRAPVMLSSLKRKKEEEKRNDDLQFLQQQ